MKKRIVSILASLCLAGCAFAFVGCGHEHTYAEEWSKNETHHWHAATCEHTEEKKDYAEHVDEDENGVCDVCKNGEVAVVGNVSYSSLEDAMDEAAANSTVTLKANVTITRSILVDKKLTLNLNGFNISRNTDKTQTLAVLENGDLTIEGNGIVNGCGQSEYDIALYVHAGKATINGGTYTNVGAGEDTQYDLIYAGAGGEIIINGGTFISETPKWTLNLQDNSGSSIKVRGGSFTGYNPSESDTEPGGPVNFVDEGYTVQENNGVYTVVAE